MSGTILLQLARELQTASNLGEMMQFARKASQQCTRFDRVYCNLVSPDRKSLAVIGYVLPDMDMVHNEIAMVEFDKDPWIQWLIASPDVQVFEDMRLNKEADARQIAAVDMRTLITIPMLVNETTLGPLCVATFGKQGVMPPTEMELEFFKQVASLVGVTIVRFRAEQERKSLEEKLMATQRMESLGRLAGEVAHDFNNILLIIRGNTELAADELQNHSALSYINMIRDATTRATALSRQLLAFSKGQVLAPRIVDLNTLIETNLKLLRSLLPKNISLQEIPPKQPIMVNVDTGQLEQVIMNLVMNARDAMPNGGQIIVETQVVLVDEEYIANHSNVPPGRYALMSVTDNGHGMTLETQRKIFEPFFTTKSPDKGTGLGLSVVQGIVSQHNGHIHVYSEMELGTTFKIYLPLCEQRAVEIGSKLPPRADELAGTESVLIVDDQVNVRDTVAAVMRKAGYRVYVAGEAREAHRLLEETKIELLLTDIVMPGTNGLSLAEAASRKYPALEILLMTGYAPNQFREVPWNHITKPFTPTELLVQVRALLDDRESDYQPE